MLRKILIANRGEIACRIIATCQEMGIATVAVYSDADKNTRHVDMAEEAVHIGGRDPQDSYLNIEKIIAAAKRTGADAIHPGYGFLAEDAVFAYSVRSAGLTFVGPSPEAIEMMGNKRIAKLILNGIPYLPSYVEDRESNDVLIAAAREMGFPLVIQVNADPAAKPLRLVQTEAELTSMLLDSVREEATSAFGDAKLTLEKYVLEPRLIRIQIIGDYKGKIIAIGERECSIQQDGKLLISEAPSTLLTGELRRELSQLAVMIGQQMGYYSCGSIDFLLDDHHRFYFWDMHPSIQADHALTEAVYGVDLVRWQVQIARGVALAALMPLFTQSDHFTYEPYGHAVQAHIHATLPQGSQQSTVGQIVHWHPHEHVRTDSALKIGDTIYTDYESLLARVTTNAETRLEATRQLDYALARTQLLGIDTNLALLRRILMEDDYLAGIITVAFVAEHPELLNDAVEISPITLIATALAKQLRQVYPQETFHHIQWRDQHFAVQVTPLATKDLFQVQIANWNYDIEVWALNGVDLTLSVDGYAQTVTVVDATDGKSWVHTADHTYTLQRTSN